MSTDDPFTEEISEPCPEGRGITLDDFVAYLPSGVYIFTPCRETWTGKSVNARLPRIPVLTKAGMPKLDKDGKPITILATTWLDRNRAVVQMTWCPGYPMLIEDRMVVDGGWIERPEVTCFNHYRPPRIASGDASRAGLWLDHFHKIYPDERDNRMYWITTFAAFAARQSRPRPLWGGAEAWAWEGP